MKVWLARAGFVLVMAGLARPVRAVEPEPWLEVIGRPITSVNVVAPPNEDTAQLLRLSGLKISEPYRVGQIRRAIELLFSIGRFDTVRVRARPEGEGVALTLELPPEPRLTEIRLEASEVFTESDIEELLRLQIGDVVGPADLRRMQKILERRLEDRGYRDPAVGLALQSVDAQGGHALAVRIQEGPVTRLRRFVVTGRPTLPLWQVGEQTGFRKGDILDILLAKESLDALETLYRGLGYLDVQIDEPVVRPVSGTFEADLLVDIRAGPKVRVRVEGHHAIPGRVFDADTKPLFELGTGPSVLAEVEERIRERYSKRGFWEVKVDVATRSNPDRSHREILFSIREGPQGSVKSLEFPGNEALEPEALRERVWATVARGLGSDLRRPGADPEVVGSAFGDRSVSTPRDSPQPDSTAPDPKKIFLSRAYRAATDAIEDMYRAEGYQTAEVRDPRVREVSVGKIAVEIPVEEGVRWRVGALSFAGNQAVPAAELLELSGLESTSTQGAPLSFARVEEARRAILAHYRDSGYLYVQLSEELRQVPPRGSFGWDFVQTSTVTPLDVQAVCARAEETAAKDCDVELRFRIDEGVQVEAGEVIVRGVEKTRRGVIEDEVRVTPGRVLTEADLIATRDNLLRIGVFERVKVRPVDEGRPDRVKDVLVEVKERRSYSFDLGGGFSTSEGLRGVVGFGDRNLFGTALRLQLQAKLNLFLPPQLVLYDESVRDAVRTSYTCKQFDEAVFQESGTIECIDQLSVLERLEYEVAMGLSYPRIFGLPDGFSAGLDMIVLRDYDAAFAEDAQRITLLGNYKGYRPKILGKERPFTVQLRTSFERSDLRCNQTFPEDRASLCSTQVDPSQNSVRLEGTNFYLGAGPQVSFDLRDDPFDPRRGVYMELSSEAALGLDAGSPNLFSVQGRVNGYVPLASRLTLALAAVVGRVITLGGDDLEIPINRRFFAGGRSTVRGYAERTLIPQDAPVSSSGVAQSTISTGGRSLLALKSELRIALYGPVSLALFYDIGDLWEGGFALSTTQTAVDGPSGEQFTRRLAQGGGLGIRIATPIGPLALDFAVPFNKRDPIVNDAQLHFSVGAF